MVAASILTFLLASTASVCAQSSGLGQICGTSVKRTDVARRDWHVQRRHPSPAKRSDNSTLPVTIDVYIHVISSDGTEEGGNVNDATISAQMDILNERFQPTGFDFNFVETTRTINEDWYYNTLVDSPYEREVMAVLRKGDFATLNVIVMGTVNTTEMAWATLPVSQAAYDGIFINNTVFLGGSNPIYTSGITLVHEVGHWFGLYHPFNFGCRQSYDYVADTPFQTQPLGHGGCDPTQDTCPDQPGLDSIHNYMAYTTDECRTEFTPGQIQRMREQMTLHRGVAYPGINIEDIPEDSVEIPPNLPEDE